MLSVILANHIIIVSQLYYLIILNSLGGKMNTNQLKKLSLFVILFIFCHALVWSADTTKTNSFRFVFMTDIHIQPERGAIEGFKAAINAVNALKPKPAFVITGGDLIMDALAQGYGRADSLYKLYIETEKLFQMPVYNTIGNHEIFGLYKQSNIEPSHLEYGKKMYANRLGEGKTYRSFDFKNWHFVLLDAMGMTPERKYIGHVDSTQLKWLKQDLETTGAERPLIIVTHIPFYTIYSQYLNGPTAEVNKALIVVNAHEISKVCEDYNLKLVLQGHLHTVEEIFYRDVRYIIGGSVCGAWWKGAHQGFAEGFVVVDIEGDSFSWKYHTFGWDAEKYNR